MVQPSTKKFFVYGMMIAALEEFITQGILKGSYVSWVFTLIPFGLFLVLASRVRTIVHRRATGWRAPGLYYVISGGIGLAIEWFIIGLSPWSDRTSPLLLVVVFHAGMFSFWGTVALGPHILLDRRSETAGIRRRFAGTFAALMAATYVLTLTAKLKGADQDVQFLAGIGPVIITFLAMNVFYVAYFRAAAQDAGQGILRT